VQVQQLDYELPAELIAQQPSDRRDGARMCVLERGKPDVRHGRIVDLPGELPPSLWIFNDTQVIPARLMGKRPSGGKVELLLLEKTGADHEWVCMAKPAKALREGMSLDFGSVTGVVVGRTPEHKLRVRFETLDGSVSDALEQVGEMPLPPYIRRPASDEDARRYQTIFAREPGAVAAPTAGLHFSEALMAGLKDAGHKCAWITLHVGPGTFAPVKVDDLTDHPMHSERFAMPAATARAIADARREGRPIVAVGTTVVRTLEGLAAANGGELPEGPGATRLLIQPPYAFQVVDALLTNFHLPRSTLLALVMAFAGESAIRGAYAEAIRERYRFFSYGDAMLIRPVSTGDAK
jgi:S-adenosylmethionine:tRNA ribosyltransferase-isomerase